MKTPKNKAFFASLLVCLSVSMSTSAQAQQAPAIGNHLASFPKLLNHAVLFAGYQGERLAIQSTQSGLCLSAWWRNTPCVAHPESNWVIKSHLASSFVQFYNPLTQLCLGMAPHHNLILGGVSCASSLSRWQVVGETGKDYTQSRMQLTYYRGLCVADVPSRTSAFAAPCTGEAAQVYRILPGT